MAAVSLFLGNVCSYFCDLDLDLDLDLQYEDLDLEAQLVKSSKFYLACMETSMETLNKCATILC